MHQLRFGHAGISNGEIKPVADGIAQVIVVDNMKTILHEHPFHDSGLFSIFLHLLHEIEAAVAGGFEHSCQGILRRMAGSGGEGVKDPLGNGIPESSTPEPSLKVGIFTAEKGGRNGHHRNTLSGVTENLGSRNEKDVVAGVFGYRRLPGRPSGGIEVPTEVHAEIGQIFHDDHIVFFRKLPDDPEFLFGQANPGRIVRVGIDDGMDIPLLEVTLQFGTQFFSSECKYIETFVFQSGHHHLLFLNRKPGIDEERHILLLVGMGGSHKCSIGSLHDPNRRNAGRRGDIHIHKSFDEPCGFLLQCRNAVHHGIDGSHTRPEGFDLRFNTHLGRLQPRNAHLHPDIFNARLAFHTVHQRYNLADRRLARIGNPEFFNDGVN